ncbi:MAG: hypothetical protein QM661_09715 [Solimonas sp.]
MNRLGRIEKLEQRIRPATAPVVIDLSQVSAATREELAAARGNGRLDVNRLSMQALREVLSAGKAAQDVQRGMLPTTTPEKSLYGEI